MVICIVFGAYLRLDHFAVSPGSAYACKVCLNTSIDGVSE